MNTTPPKDAASVLRDALTAVLALPRGTSGRIILELSDEARAHSALAATERAATQPAGEAVYAVLYDDADMRPVVVVGEAAARATFERIGKKGYNAHLFAKVQSNSRDDPYYECNIAIPQEAKAEQGELSRFDIELLEQKFPLPETTYCGTGSKPLYTSVMVYAYAHKHIVAMAHARAPELNKALEHIAKLEKVISNTAPACVLRGGKCFCPTSCQMNMDAARQTTLSAAPVAPAQAVTDGMQRLETVKFWADAFADDPQRVAGAMIVKLLNEYAELRAILAKRAGSTS